MSECLYPDQFIIIQGLPWCRDKAKRVRIETFTQPILCDKHNRQLGEEVDWAVRHSLENLRRAFELLIIRENARSRHWNIQHFEIDMYLLERWCLKTLININHQEGWRYWGGKPTKPPKELVEVVFGRRRFTKPEGLYCAVETDGSTEVPDHRSGVKVTLLRTAFIHRLFAAKFFLWKFPFYLHLLPTRIQPKKMQWEMPKFIHHDSEHLFNVRDDKGRQVLSHILNFTYPEDP